MSPWKPLPLFTIAVLLTAMQTPAPVPRKGDGQHRASPSQSTKEQSQGDQTAPPKTGVQPVTTEPQQHPSSTVSAENTQNPQRISELPPVSISRDWLDKVSVGFTLILVVVGCLGVRAAYRTLKAIEGQAAIMGGQLRTMGEQLGEMRSAAKQTDRLIEQAAKQAEELALVASAAKDSADAAKYSIETMVSKGRARLKIEVGSFASQSQTVSPTSFNGVECWGRNNGATTASIDDFKARLFHADTKEIAPDYAQCKQLLYAESLEPNESTLKFVIPLEPNPFLTDDDIMRIREAKSFIHFYGFAKYQDVFKRKRRVTIHMRWTMRWGGMIQGQVMQWWEPVGAPEDNSDTEDTSSN
jgi:hypothetical protein